MSIHFMPKCELITTNSSAYYCLVLEERFHKYYIVKRSGKIGAKYPISPDFDGIPILSPYGYDFAEDAWKDAYKKVKSKIAAKNKIRKYRPLKKGESLIYKEIEAEGHKRSVIELEEVDMIKRNGNNYITLNNFL